jgi:hypothetical protein
VIVKDTRRYINDLDGWDDTPIPVVDDNGITIKEHPDSTLMK